MKRERNETTQREYAYFGTGMLVGVLCATLLMAGTVAVIKLVEYRQARATAVAEQAAASEEAQTDGYDSVLNDRTLSKMGSIENVINQYYYLSDVDEETLEDGIYRGMVTALDDKYADYFTEEELEEQLKDNEGIYYGIAAYISIDQETSYPFISGIIEGGTAEEAGLRPQDTIYQVDGESTFQMSLTDVVSRVKGDEGTTVTLSILRGDEVFDVEVKRRKVDRPTVTSEMLEGDIGYLNISEFDSVTVGQFTENYKKIREDGAKGLILDLRGNPGGLLDAVVSIGQQILPKGLIVYTEDKAGNREEHTCDGAHEIDIPLVVLVDGGSASASEILTGAIKDYGIGTIMGTKTYGKGIVQKMYGLSDGSAIKLTVSAYYTPKGNNIHGVGIEPDVEIPFDADAYYSEDKVDNQKEAAISYLQEMIGE